MRGTDPRPRGRSAAAAERFDAVAGVAHRLAVLIEAGVAPVSAWHYVAEVGDHGRTESARIAAAVARASERGAPLDQALELAVRGSVPELRRAWSSMAAAWQVASASGSPLGPCLRGLAEALRDVGELHRAVSVALAAPVSTARLMSVLPVAGLGLGVVLGFDPLGTLLSTAPGLICLGVGVTLLLVANRWTALLVRRASPSQVGTGLALELMAIALTGGVSVERARALVQRALHSFELDERDEDSQVDTVVTLSDRAGVPAVDLLRSEAVQARRTARAAHQRRAASLSVQLMVPLGVCILPAFMALGVIPIVFAVFSSTFRGW